MLSYYIRGSNGTCLVRIPGGLSNEYNKAMLAVQEAEEQGCAPSGTRIIYEVVPQDEMFYNRLWTSEEAKELMTNGKRTIR